MPVYDWLHLDHLDRMTDSTGLIQHAIYSIPRRGERLHDRRQCPPAIVHPALVPRSRRSHVVANHVLLEFFGARAVSGAADSITS